MRPFRIYVDTSVIGGCFDSEFAEWSRLLFEDFRSGRLAPVLSDVVAMEIAPAPPWIRAIHDELLALPATQLMLTQDVIDLARAYRDQRVLRERSWEDMLHVALASIARVDALVSWNFRHLVRPDRIRAFNDVNAQRGIGALVIASPREVTFYGEA